MLVPEVVRNTAVEVRPHRADLLFDGVDAFPAMLELIANAQEQVLLEMYWFGADQIGQRFRAALIDAAKRGVQVHVIFDAVGSYQTPIEFWQPLRDAGAEVVEFGALQPWRATFRLEELNRRDHRKMLIVDTEAAVTGGINIGDPWLAEERGGEGWRDDMIRLEGPVVAEMRLLFEVTWTHLKYGWKAHLLGNGGKHKTVCAEMPAPSSRLLANSGALSWRDIRVSYLKRIRAAEKSIFISNSYFLPDLRIRFALKSAARRGVDVRVLVPGTSDVPAVYHAMAYKYAALLRAGIRIFEWRGSMLHSKSAVIDERYTTVGTYNLDYRSWLFNLEVAVEVDCQTVAKEMSDRLHSDLRFAEEVSLEQWNKRGWSRRIAEWLAYRVRKLL